ncbi:protein MEI2-like 4 isoform X2 [Impatiens glandulifera]|uniref:protein MEI2-like 4 isoform X2 n=1 Tax=Impatiens glandulifera TaxID=253017 RepID=UPI001FB11D69|nr:protein MEI2-like 4 isoform X2 [Impatiens glandulifera]XP_047324620.1 protein MEI2-like 4 isoform X2 [Impatiens glandulifera]
MPSERMDSNGLSSSFFSEHVHFPNERQVGFWKSGTSPADYASAAAHNSSIVSSPLESQAHSFGHHDPRIIQSPKFGHSLEKHAVGAERAAMKRHLDLSSGARSILKADPSSFPKKGEGNHMMGVQQYENGLFSSSLSELFSRHCHSGTAVSPYDEVDPFESLEEIEAQTIGNLLPDDEDLLSGVTDGLDYAAQHNGGDDAEDLDLFNSVGGMDLGDDNFRLGKSDFNLEHSSRENPSRTLFVRNINSSIEDSELHTLFEQYGDIRTLYTTCKNRGFVMISYYDIRAAKNAMKALQHKPLRHRKLDIHFSFPKDNPSEKDVNQGTLMISNLDSSVSNEEICQIFGDYGEIKEIYDGAHQSQHKLIEFYDVRDAEAALHALNQIDIAGKLIKVETKRQVEQDESSFYLQLSNLANNSALTMPGSFLHRGMTSSSMDNGALSGTHSSIQSPYNQFLDNAFRHGISSSVPNSLMKLDSIRQSLPNNSPTLGHMKFDFQGSPNLSSQNLHPHSLPEYHDGFTTNASCNSPSIAANVNIIRPAERIENLHFSRLSSNPHSIEMNDTVFSSSANGGSSAPRGSPYMWSNNSPQTQGMMWPNSSSFVSGSRATHPHALPRAHMMSSILPPNHHHHHVGSAPSSNHSIWERQTTYAGDSPDASGFHPGSLGNSRMSVPQNMFSHVGGNYVDLPLPSQNVGHPQRCFMFPGRGQMVPMASSFECLNERTRSRRSEGSSNQIDNKKQFELDIDRILGGEDIRTTLMIKNIPNKYTSKMLLAAIDDRHRGTYDFLYLPIDFKNKCNVGYAFINMIDPSMIIPFYQAFNGKKWEKFNSEKVASLAYGRIQGKPALIAHFQNSSLMNEDKRCRPILFNTEGPNAGDQVPFPMGVNIRARPSKSRAGTSEENHQEQESYVNNEPPVPVPGF